MEASSSGSQGETPCNTCFSAGKPFGPITSAGILAGDGNGNLSGQQDAGAVGQAYSGITLSGSYTNPSALGRGAFSISQTGSTYPAAPSDAIYYIVNANELLMMSSDSHANTTLLSGDLELQQQAAYSLSSPSGTLVTFESGSAGGRRHRDLPHLFDRHALLAQRHRARHGNPLAG